MDADITGSRTSLAVIGEPMGYATTPCLAFGGQIIALRLDNAVVLLTAADGRTRTVLPIEGNANTVCTDQTGVTLAIATDQGLRHIKP